MIPTSDDMLIPYLRFVGASTDTLRGAIADQVAQYFGLTDGEADSDVFKTRLSWTISYLKMAGYVSVAPSTVWITRTGVAFLQKYPTEAVNRDILAQESPSFAEFLARSKKEQRSDSIFVKRPDTLDVVYKTLGDVFNIRATY